MKMKKWIAAVILGSMLMTQMVPAAAWAEPEAEEDTAAQEENSDDTAEEVAEDPMPECYYWPIESNEIKGWPQGPQIQAESAVVMDADYGTILYSKNAHAKQYPASITKIMTTLIALEHCEDTRNILTFSEEAVDISSDSSQIWASAGEELTLEQCFYAIMLASANEVSNAVAEYTAGSIEAFVEMMNERAQQIGCKNTHFTNVNGLPDEDHYTTAYDMALIAREAYKNRTLRRIASTPEYIIPPTNYTDEPRYLYNHHKMLPGGAYGYEGCEGGKTGYTMAAGNTLVTYSREGDKALICVDLKTDGSVIYEDTAALLDYGYDNFEWRKVRNSVPTMGRIALPNQQFVLNQMGRLSLSESRGPGWALVPKGVWVRDLTMKKTMEPNKIGPWREKTTYYYNDWQVGYSYKYERPYFEEMFNF